MTTAPDFQLTPIRITVTRPNFRTGRNEIWEAESKDGLWKFIRTDEPGTPWFCERTGYGGFVRTGSLLSAQQISANGYALAQLERQQREIAAAAGGTNA